jgi:MFS family permease
VVGQSFLTFMPVFYVQKGYSLVAAGVMFSLFTIAGTVSGIVSGYLSDRIGYKSIFMVTHFLMTPALILLLYLPGNWVYAGAFLAGCFVLATMPLGVTMAQALAPKGRAMVSSLMMGLAYGLGPVAGGGKTRGSLLHRAGPVCGGLYSPFDAGVHLLFPKGGKSGWKVIFPTLLYFHSQNRYRYRPLKNYEAQCSIAISIPIPISSAA